MPITLVVMSTFLVMLTTLGMSTSSTTLSTAEHARRPSGPSRLFTVLLETASTPGYKETWLYHNHIPLCCDITLNVFSSIFMTNILDSLLFFNVILKEKTVLALLEKWHGSFEEGIYGWKRQKRKYLLTVLSHFSKVSLNRSYKSRWNNNQTNLKHHCPLWLDSYVMQDIGLPFEGRQTSNLISRESWLKIGDVNVGPTERDESDLTFEFVFALMKSARER